MFKLKSEEASKILVNKFYPKSYRSLAENFYPKTYRSLAETTLTHLVLFNRKRPGEMERLSLDDFNERKNIDEKSDYYESMDFVTSLFLMNMFLLEWKGKKSGY